MQDRAIKERSFWDSFAKLYDLFINRFSNSIYQKLYDNLQNDVLGYDNLLEVATGTGLLALRLSQQVAHVTAIDISPKMIEIARKKAADARITNITFDVQDSYNLDFDDERFNLVVCSNVLHLLYHPEKAILEIHRVLKPDGILIAPTFCHGENRKSKLTNKLMNLTGFSAKSRWSITAYQQFIEDGDFSIVTSETMEGSIPLEYLKAKKVSGLLSPHSSTATS